jgi:purine-binding chemotaxis protein CheW
MDDEPRRDSARVAHRCIAVSVAGSLYGLPMQDVQEVIGMRPLTRVFHAPSVLAGVTSLRGEVLPVIDLGLLLGASDGSVSGGRDARIVVVREALGAKRRAGLQVDELRGLRELPEAGLAPPPPTASERVREVLAGIIPSAPPCSVLDITAIFNAPELGALSGRGQDSDDD